MELKDKELLFNVICETLPYGVNVQYIAGDGAQIDCGVDQVSVLSKCVGIFELGTKKTVWRDVEYVKPYLRQISSMTEEEKDEYNAFFNYDGIEYPSEYVDWLNAHHFDFRGLLQKGLAIEAPEGMYNK